MTIHTIEVKAKVLRSGRELSLDTAAREASARLFAQVADYLGSGVQFPRTATIAYSWLQEEVTAETEQWSARAEITLHPADEIVENPHSVPMDNQINAQAG